MISLYIQGFMSGFERIPGKFCVYGTTIIGVYYGTAWHGWRIETGRLRLVQAAGGRGSEYQVILLERFKSNRRKT